MASDSTDSKRRPGPTMVEQVRLLVENADRLDELVKQSGTLAPDLSPEAVIRSLAKSTGLPLDVLILIFNAIDNLSDIRGHRGSSDEAVQSLIDAFGPDALPGLEQKRTKIAAAIDLYSPDNPIAVSLKARRLAFLREKLFVEAEIITDARPVFDASGGKVLEYVVTNSLVITYHEDEGDDSRAQHKHHRIHVSLDHQDILTLRKIAERAVLKGQALLKDLDGRARMLGAADED